jgi:hypothetical protein
VEHEISHLLQWLQKGKGGKTKGDAKDFDTIKGMTKLDEPRR